MKSLKLSTSLVAEASFYNSNITSTVKSDLYTQSLISTARHSVWARSRPLVQPLLSTRIGQPISINRQSYNLIYNRTLVFNYVRFNKNSSLSSPLLIKFIQPSSTKLKGLLWQWISTTTSLTSHWNITFGLLKISLFPFLQTLNNLSARYRRPTHPLLSSLTNLTINL